MLPPGSPEPLQHALALLLAHVAAEARAPHAVRLQLELRVLHADTNIACLGSQLWPCLPSAVLSCTPMRTALTAPHLRRHKSLLQQRASAMLPPWKLCMQPFNAHAMLC